VSGVAASLSTRGVLGVSPPELKSQALAGVRGSQACDWRWAGSELAGVLGSALLDAVLAKYPERLGVAKLPT